MAMPLAASTISIATTSGAVPGHWVTDDDACRYWPAFATPADAISTANDKTSFFMVWSPCQV